MADIVEFIASLGNVAKMAERSKENIAAQQEALNAKAAELEGARKAHTENAIELRNEEFNASRKIVQLMDLDPNQADNALERWITERKQREVEQTQLFTEIQEKQNLGFFDDPLKYVMNQYTINDTIDRHNAVVDRRNTLTNNIESIETARSQATAAHFAGVKATDIRFQQAAAEAEKLKAQEISFNLSGEMAKMNLTSWGAELNALGEGARAEQLKIAAINDEKRMAMQAAAHKLQMESLQKQKLGDDFFQNVSNGIAKRFYGLETLPAEWAKLGWSAPGEEGASFRAMAQAVVTGGAVGNTPGEAFISLAARNANLGANPEVAQTYKWGLDQITAELETKVKAKSLTYDDWKKLGIQGQANTASDWLSSKVVTPVRKGTYQITSKEDPYYATSIANLRAAFKGPNGLDAIPLWKERITQLPQGEKLDPNVVLREAYSMFKAGAPINDIVRDVRVIYGAVNKYNAVNKGLLNVYNLPALEKSHIVPLEKGEFLSGKPAFADMLNATTIQTELVRMRAKEANERKLNKFGHMPWGN